MIRNITTPVGTVKTIIEGSGNPVIFIHGIGGNAEQHWAKLVKTLEPKVNWMCIQPNYFGPSISPIDNHINNTINLEMIKTKIISVLDILKITKAHLVGFSLGAAIALYLAGTQSERVLSVSSIGGFINTSSASTQLIFDLWLKMIASDKNLAAKTIGLYLFGSSYLFNLNNNQLASLIDKIETNTSWEEMIQQIELNKTINIESTLNSITQPVLILTGSQDTIIPYEYANQLYHHLPQSKMIQVDTGHASMLEQPEEIANLLVNFIKDK